MVARRRSNLESGFSVRPDRPLIGVVLVENGQVIARYFADEEEADAAMAPESTERARALAGVWSDLDWDEAVDALERIRHDVEPTPPIENV